MRTCPLKKQFIQVVDPPFSACLKCKETNSVLLVIDSKSVITVESDIVAPKFPRIKSLKSLKSMLGNEAKSGLATTCGMNSNPKDNC